MEKGTLNDRKSSIDLLGEFDLGPLKVGEGSGSGQQFDLGDIPFGLGNGSRLRSESSDSGGSSSK